MNPETKLSIAFLCTALVGMGLIFLGAWPAHQIGAMLVGIATVVASLVLFAIVWRSR